MKDLARSLRTIRHLQPAQVFHRVRLTARRRAWELAGPRIDASYRAAARILGPARFGAPGLAAVATYRSESRTREDRARVALEAQIGRFRFLERTLDLGQDVDWHRPDLETGTRLWKTQLHEFPYAIDLALTARAAGDDGLSARLFSLVESWEAACPIGRPGFALDSWNARAVATRLTNLSVAGSILGLEPGDSRSEWLGSLLARHALFLRDNLELDLRANHLLRDVAGLVFARALFGGFEDALSLLREQIDEQVLPDGAHIERTPLYHAIALQDLLEIRLLLGEESPRWLRDAILRMGGFLSYLLHGDEDLPLFGDSWQGEVSPVRLLAAIRALPEADGGLPEPHLPETASGLLALTRADAKLVVRAGAHGPDWQLGHAHGDLLSFELSIGRQRIVTDTGTLTYDPGPARSALRATAAHNTIEIDGRSQIEAWGSFRVGRRGRAWTVSRGNAERWSYLWAAHDAYSWLPGRPLHHRLFALSERALLLLDVVLGSKAHRIDNRLHLAPFLPESCVTVAPLRGEARSSEAPCHPRWGETLPATRLSTHHQGDLPYVGGWILGWQGGAPGPAEISEVSYPGGSRVRFVHRLLGVEIDWAVAGRADGEIRLRPLPHGG